jgi:hypothetical protein
MILGMSTFTFVHVLICLAGIGSGLVVAYGLLSSRPFDNWTIVFLTTTLATTITGFLFPFHGFTPAIGVGILTTIALIVAVVARYRFALHGGWRWLYVVGAIVSLYFNVFVLVVQAFAKIAPLKALVPTQSEPPFVITQAAVLLCFIALGIFAVRGFKPPVVAHQ